MGLFSRRKAPALTEVTARSEGPASHHPSGTSAASAATAGAAERPPWGRYGPLVTIGGFDTTDHEELAWQTPVEGELYRLVPGPDRPDYSIMVLEKPLHFYPGPSLELARVHQDLLTEDRKGRRMVRVHGIALCARFVGQQIAPGMQDLPVNVAFAIDDAALREPTLDLAKIEYAGVGLLSEGHGLSAGGREAEVEDPWSELAHTLRAGIEAERGAPVTRLHATLALDDTFRISGLTGHADGRPPAPTVETFDRLNRILERLRAEPRGESVRSVTLSIDGDEVGATTLES